MDENSLHIDIQEVSREELIKTFEILHERGLINLCEMQNAINIAIEKYKPIKQLIRKPDIN